MQVTVLSGKAVKWQSCKASSGIPPSLVPVFRAVARLSRLALSLARARSCRLFCGCSICCFCFRSLKKQYKHFTRSGYAVAVAIFSRSEVYRTSLPTFFASRIGGVSLSLSLSLSRCYFPHDAEPLGAYGCFCSVRPPRSASPLCDWRVLIVRLVEVFLFSFLVFVFSL
jgi:hypothetical protein